MIIKRVRGMPSLQSGYRIFTKMKIWLHKISRSNGWSHSKGNVEAFNVYGLCGWEENVLDADQSETHRAYGKGLHIYRKMHFAKICKQFHGPFNSNNIDTIQKNISHLFMKN